MNQKNSRIFWESQDLETSHPDYVFIHPAIIYWVPTLYLPVFVCYGYSDKPELKFILSHSSNSMENKYNKK